MATSRAVCLRMDPPGRAFGFSWLAPVWPRKPQFLSVGLSWISLDSLVRIETFQWVARVSERKIFLGPLSVDEPPVREPAVFHAEAGFLHKRRLVHFLTFCKKSSALIALAIDPQLVRVIRKYANLSVMAGLDPAIHAASAPFASYSNLSNIIIALIA
jgi:hypothetical protein